MSDLDYIASELRELAVPVESLRLDPQNARLHDEANHFHVRSMLAQFGQLVPIVAARKTGTVLKGNCTLEETRELGRTHIAVVWWTSRPMTPFRSRCATTAPGSWGSGTASD